MANEKTEEEIKQADPLRGPTSKTQTNGAHSAGVGQITSTSGHSLNQNQSFPVDSSKIKSAAQMKMSCDRCSVNFSLFKRKKFCQECHRFFCSSCLPKSNSGSTVGRQCSKCRLLMSGHFSRDDLQTWKISDMRSFLTVRNISTKDCREKHDLVELVLQKFCTLPRQSVQDQVEHETLVQQMAARMRDVSFANESSNTGTSNENSPTPQRNAQTEPEPEIQSQTSAAATQTTSANPSLSTSGTIPSMGVSSAAQTSAANLNRTTNETQSESQGMQFEINNDTLRELLESMERIQAIITQQDELGQSDLVEQPVRRTQLDDIADISDIGDLSILQLKELLVNNFVDYKGCCEKAELVEKTKRLWKDYKENKLRAQRIHKQDETGCYGNQNDKGDSEGTAVPEKLKEESASPAAETAHNDSKDQDVTPIDINSEDKAATSIETLKPVPKSTVASSSGELPTQRDDSLCHICMDSLVDCILLECGHMVTCTQCGKRLADCPICRQYIVRVVRVFRP